MSPSPSIWAACLRCSRPGGITHKQPCATLRFDLAGFSSAIKRLKELPHTDTTMAELSSFRVSLTHADLLSLEFFTHYIGVHKDLFSFITIQREMSVHALAICLTFPDFEVTHALLIKMCEIKGLQSRAEIVSTLIDTCGLDPGHNNNEAHIALRHFARVACRRACRPEYFRQLRNQTGVREQWPGVCPTAA